MHKQWKAWGTSVIGPSHKKNGMSNQDSWLFRSWKDRAALAVSDGLGSKPFSDTGSKAVCMAVMEAAKIFYLHPGGNFNYLPQLIHAFWLIKIGDTNPSDCAATCLFAVIIREKVILGRLGDGFVQSLGKDKSFIMEDKKENGFSNITNCMTDIFTAGDWEIIEIPTEDCDAVVFCTDGVSNDIVEEKKTSFAKDFYAEYKNMNAKKRSREITQWLTKWPVPGHSDDKTLACLYRRDS
jgi:serine/threonine protein phosphatase PrpC